MFPLTDLSVVTTFNPGALASDAAPQELLSWLEEGTQPGWPVIDAQQHVVGVVSHEELVVALSRCSVPHPAGAVATLDAAGPVQTLLSMRRISVDTSESPRRALKLMLEHNLSCLPVTEDGRLVGTITPADFLRELSYQPSALGAQPVAPLAAPVQERVEIDTSLADAEVVMNAARLDFVAVEKQGAPVGIVTRRDLRAAQLRRLARSLRGESHPSTRLILLTDLAAQAPTLRPGQTLREAANLLGEHGMQAVAVVNQAHRLMGVLTESTLLRAWLDE